MARRRYSVTCRDSKTAAHHESPVPASALRWKMTDVQAKHHHRRLQQEEGQARRRRECRECRSVPGGGLGSFERHRTKLTKHRLRIILWVNRGLRSAPRRQTARRRGRASVAGAAIAAKAPERRRALAASTAPQEMAQAIQDDADDVCLASA